MKPISNLLAWKLSAAQASSLQTGAQLHDVAMTLEELEVSRFSSLDLLTNQLPGGAYTTLRTFHGNQALCLEDHFQRLEHTAFLVGKPLHLAREVVRQALRRALNQATNHFAQLQIRARSSNDTREDISTGQTPVSKQTNRSTPADFRLRLILDLQVNLGDVFIAIQPLVIPAPEAYRLGAPAITCQLQRLLPKAKLTRFIQRSGEVRQSLPPGVNEAIMVDDAGCLLEGLSSNFFALIDGEVWTAEAGVLSGITRSLVLESVRRLNIPLHLQPIGCGDLPRMQEAFITSSSRAVLPLRQIDAYQLPQSPGPITRRLMDDYAAALEVQLEII